MDVKGLRTGERHTSMAIVSVDEAGERSFRFIRGADRELPPEGVDEDEVRKGRFPLRPAPPGTPRSSPPARPTAMAGW